MNSLQTPNAERTNKSLTSAIVKYTTVENIAPVADIADVADVVNDIPKSAVFRNLAISSVISAILGITCAVIAANGEFYYYGPQYWEYSAGTIEAAWGCLIFGITNLVFMILMITKRRKAKSKRQKKACIALSIIANILSIAAVINILTLELIFAF